MRIGELARQAGVNVETVRYYERRGLLPEPTRTNGGHRDYSDEALRFVRAVKEAQGLGFSLGEIEAFLRGAQRAPTDASNIFSAGLTAKIADVDGAIAELQRLRSGLTRAREEQWESVERSTSAAAYLARGGRDPELRPGEPLHVTNGESAASTLRQALDGAAVLSWVDSLHVGPLAFDPAESRKVRSAFLAECGLGSADAIERSLQRRDETLERAARERLVLWFEHDLYDQLQLLQILSALAEREGGHVELVQTDVYLGSLAGDELKQLYPTRRPLDQATLHMARDAWRDVCAGSLADPLGRDLGALPHLRAALARLEEEHETPLPRTKRQLLQALAGEASTPLEAFFASQAMEEAVFLGDIWAFRALHELAEEGLVTPLPPPPPRGDREAFVSAHADVTAAGRRLLERSLS